MFLLGHQDVDALFLRVRVCDYDNISVVPVQNITDGSSVSFMIIKKMSAALAHALCTDVCACLFVSVCTHLLA